MDRTEAIKRCDRYNEEWANARANDVEPFIAYDQSLDDLFYMAGKALREQEQSNEPLTWEELRKMGRKPVWIVWPDGRIASQWWIVGSSAWYMMEFFEEHSAMVYGTDWIAYRKPPKEGAEG